MKFGTMEQWNNGTMEPWNTGTLEHWNPGTIEPSIANHLPVESQIILHQVRSQA
jgi:hypothetical protein